MALGTESSKPNRRRGTISDVESMSDPMHRVVAQVPNAYHAGLVRGSYAKRGEVGNRGMPRMVRSRHILVGNSFPLSLVARRVVIEPVSVRDLQAGARDRRVHSFWGHSNTLAPAQQAMGIAFVPESDRPVLGLDEQGYPSLDGTTFHECWIVSPVYVESFRPRIGDEVPPEMIRDWQVLRMRWQDA